MGYTQDDNLLIQSYFTLGLLMELNNQKFLESEYFKNIEFQDTIVKANLPSYGIDNQGTLMIFLYVTLVLSKQLLSEKFPEEFIKLNTTIDQIKISAVSTYKKDKDGIDFIRHIRNSVAPARVEFNPTISVTFIDENNSNEECKITIALKNIGIFLTQLQLLHRKHLITCVFEGKNK